MKDNQIRSLLDQAERAKQESHTFKYNAGLLEDQLREKSSMVEHLQD